MDHAYHSSLGLVHCATISDVADYWIGKNEEPHNALYLQFHPYNLAMCLPIWRGQQSLHYNGFRTLQHDLSSACHHVTTSVRHSSSCIDYRPTVHYCIQFKLALLITWQIMAPASHQHTSSTPLRPSVKIRHALLRSAATTDFIISRTRTKFGERTFSVSGPITWNSPSGPESLRTFECIATFKRQLYKDSLF